MHIFAWYAYLEVENEKAKRDLTLFYYMICFSSLMLTYFRMRKMENIHADVFLFCM